MNGRRRHPRFALGEPLEGILQVREEVIIESRNDQEIQVISAVACRPGETLVLEIPDAPGTTIPVGVEENRPCVGSDGRVLHRVRLSIRTAREGKPQRGSTTA